MYYVAVQVSVPYLDCYWAVLVRALQNALAATLLVPSVKILVLL